MGNNQSMLDHVTNGTAFDDQELKGMLRDLLQTNPFAFGDEILNDDDEIFKDSPTVVTRNVRRRAPDLWTSGWGILIRSEQIKNPYSYEAKVFRKRFRLPFDLFQRFVEECKQANIFEDVYTTKIAIEFKLLIGLRILGRDNCADDISEYLDIGESTIYTIFKQFLSGCVKYLFPKYVYVPVGEELDEVRQVFESLGLPGCVGSMGCTHFMWHRCTKIIRNNCTGNTISLLNLVLY